MAEILSHFRVDGSSGYATVPQNTVVLLVFTCRMAGTPAATPDSVTWNSVGLTKIEDQDKYNYAVASWELIGPDAGYYQLVDSGGGGNANHIVYCLSGIPAATARYHQSKDGGVEPSYIENTLTTEPSGILIAGACHFETSVAVGLYDLVGHVDYSYTTASPDYQSAGHIDTSAASHQYGLDFSDGGEPSAGLIGHFYPTKVGSQVIWI